MGRVIQAVVWRCWWLVACCCVALPALSLAAESGSNRNSGPELGVNLAPVSDYSQTPVFVDVMEQARPFGSPTAPWDEKAQLGSDGWPKGDFGVVLMVGQARVPDTSGRYFLSFAGRAQVKAVASPATVHNLRYDPNTGRSQAEVEMPHGADQLMLQFDQTGGSVKDLHVLRPGYDRQHPPRFTTAFLQQVSQFGTLRYMDWLKTNGNRVQSWSQRPAPDRNHTLTSAGVPWERIIELANTTRTNLWINIPIDADEAYVRELAQLFRSRLNSTSLLYLEYSNEVWNAGFSQFHTNLERTREELASDPTSNLRVGGEADVNRMAYRRVARRLMDIRDTFMKVWGPQRFDQQIRPVLATQAVQPAILQLQLEFLSQAYGPPARNVFGIAIAPYFNLGKQQTQDGLTVDQVLGAMNQSVDEVATKNKFENHLALAKWYGLKLLAYEGGSDTFGPGSLRAKQEASHDTRLQAICQRYLHSWFDSGGELFMWFQAGAGDWRHPFGTWELSESIADADAPKLRCLQQFGRGYQASEPIRNRVPGVFDARSFAGSFQPFGKEADLRVRYLRANQWLDYLIWSPAAQTYRLTLLAEAGQQGNVVQIGLDGELVRERLDLPSSGWGKTGKAEAVTLRVGAGFHTLRIRTQHETTGFRLDQLRFD